MLDVQRRYLPDIQRQYGAFHVNREFLGRMAVLRWASEELSHNRHNESVKAFLRGSMRSAVQEMLEELLSSASLSVHEVAVLGGGISDVSPEVFRAQVDRWLESAGLAGVMLVARQDIATESRLQPQLATGLLIAPLSLGRPDMIVRNAIGVIHPLLVADLKLHGVDEIMLLGSALEDFACARTIGMHAQNFFGPTPSEEDVFKGTKLVAESRKAADSFVWKISQLRARHPQTPSGGQIGAAHGTAVRVPRKPQETAASGR
jgi:hypothetical protein